MIRWTDMVDPVYSLSVLAGIDPETNTITGINIQHNHLIVYYTNSNGSNMFVSKEYEL